jgi:hypothetical protein
MRRKGTICAFDPFSKKGIISLAGVPESNPKGNAGVTSGQLSQMGLAVCFQALAAEPGPSGQAFMLPKPKKMKTIRKIYNLEKRMF